MGLATVPGADETKKMVDDEKVHGVQDTVEVVRDGTKDVDDGQRIVEDIGTRVIDGAHVILKPISKPSRSLILSRR